MAYTAHYELVQHNGTTCGVHINHDYAKEQTSLATFSIHVNIWGVNTRDRGKTLKRLIHVVHRARGWAVCKWLWTQAQVVKMISNSPVHHTPHSRQSADRPQPIAGNSLKSHHGIHSPLWACAAQWHYLWCAHQPWLCQGANKSSYIQYPCKHLRCKH